MTASGPARFARDSASLRSVTNCPYCGSDQRNEVRTSCVNCEIDLADSRLGEVFDLGDRAAAMLDQREILLHRIRNDSVAAARKREREQALERARERDRVCAAPQQTAPQVEPTAVTLDKLVPLPPLRPQTDSWGAAAPSLPAAPASVAGAAIPPPAAAQLRATQPGAAMPPAAPPPTASKRPGSEPQPARPRRQLTPQAMLLTTGVVFLSIAAIVFLTVAFVMFNLTTKAIIVGGVTAAAVFGASRLKRAELPSTAEGIATLGVVLLGLDVWAVRALGMLGLDRPDAGLYWGWMLVLLSGGFALWARLGDLRAPSVASALTLVPGLTTLAYGYAAQFDKGLVSAQLLSALAVAAAFTLAPLYRRDDKPLTFEQHAVRAMGSLVALIEVLLAMLQLAFQIGHPPRLVGVFVLTAVLWWIALRPSTPRFYAAFHAMLSAIAALFTLTRIEHLFRLGLQAPGEPLPPALPHWMGAVTIAVAVAWLVLRRLQASPAATTAGLITSIAIAGGVLLTRTSQVLGVQLELINSGHLIEGYQPALITYSATTAVVLGAALLISMLLDRHAVHPPLAFEQPILASGAAFSVTLAAAALSLEAACITLAVLIAGGVAALLAVRSRMPPVMVLGIETLWISASAFLVLFAYRLEVPTLVTLLLTVVVAIRLSGLLHTRNAPFLPVALSLPLAAVAGYGVYETYALNRPEAGVLLVVATFVPVAMTLLPARWNPSELARTGFAAIATLAAPGLVALSYHTAADLGESFTGVGAALMLTLAVLLAAITLVTRRDQQRLPEQLLLTIIPVVALALVTALQPPLALWPGAGPIASFPLWFGVAALLGAALLTLRRHDTDASKFAPSILVAAMSIVAVLALCFEPAAGRASATGIVTAVSAIAAVGAAVWYAPPRSSRTPTSPVMPWFASALASLAGGTVLDGAFGVPFVTAIPTIVSLLLTAAVFVSCPFAHSAPGRWTTATLIGAALSVWMFASAATQSDWRMGLFNGGTWVFGLLALAAVAVPLPRRLEPTRLAVVALAPTFLAGTLLLMMPKFSWQPMQLVIVALTAVFMTLLVFAAVFGARRSRTNSLVVDGVAIITPVVIIAVLIAAHVRSAWMHAAPAWLYVLAMALGMLVGLLAARAATARFSAAVSAPAHRPVLVGVTALLLAPAYFAIDAINPVVSSDSFIALALLLLIAFVAAVAIRSVSVWAAALVPTAIWLATAQFSVPGLGMWSPFVTALALAVALIVTARIRYRGREMPRPVSIATATVVALPALGAATPQFGRPLYFSAVAFAVVTVALIALPLWPALSRLKPNLVRIMLVVIGMMAAIGMRVDSPYSLIAISSIPPALLLIRTAIAAARDNSVWEARSYLALAPVMTALFLIDAQHVDPIVSSIAAVVFAALVLVAVMATAKRHAVATTAPPSFGATLRILAPALLLGSASASLISLFAQLLMLNSEPAPAGLLCALATLSLLVASTCLALGKLFAGYVTSLTTALAAVALINHINAYTFPLDGGGQAPWIALVLTVAALPLLNFARRSAEQTNFQLLLVASGALVLPMLVALPSTFASGQFTPEAVTLPLGLIGAGAGTLTLHQRPQLRSWPALAIPLLLALVAGLFFEQAATEVWRVILMTLLVVAALLGGAVAKLQAPIVVGTGVGIAHAVLGFRRAFPEFAIPWWVWLALAGALLIFVAATYEARRRQLRALFESVTALR